MAILLFQLLLPKEISPKISLIEQYLVAVTVRFYPARQSIKLHIAFILYVSGPRFGEKGQKKRMFFYSIG